MTDAIDLLNKASQNQPQNAINQNQSILSKTGNAARSIAKKG